LLDLEERGEEKTADFEMVDSGERILVAELKSIEERRPSIEAGWSIAVDAEGIQEAHRQHNGPARIARKIVEAHGQLAGYQHPWAIILFNEDYFMDAGDFFEAFEGQRVLGTFGDRRAINIASRKIALGAKFAVRYEVDLYIWIDRVRKPTLGVWWSTPSGEEIAKRYFSAAAET
jgi:hypothetical protein